MNIHSYIFRKQSHCNGMSVRTQEEGGGSKETRQQEGVPGYMPCKVSVGREKVVEEC